MFARIYRPSKNAMQSGQGKSQDWVLEFEQEAAKRVDPLMGWTSTSDMNSSQVHLKFETQDAAVAYAKEHNIPYQILEQTKGERIAKSYSDNFAFQRRKPWTH